MKKIQVFDPALCCSSGVCGVDVDPALLTFSADLDWAKQQGAQVERFNLAQQPMAFADNAVVKAALEREGEAALPLLLVDGQAALSGRYPLRDELAKWLGAGEPPSIFNAQVAELVAIGAAIASNCEPCLKFHVAEARKLGVSAADMRRAVDLGQKVKDAPARAMLGLAQRLLEPATAAPRSASAKLSAIAVAAAPASRCCGPAPAAAEGAATGASKCC
jgi:AhpD family alkylhydroperoxidase